MNMVMYMLRMYVYVCEHVRTCVNMCVQVMNMQNMCALWPALGASAELQSCACMLGQLTFLLHPPFLTNGNRTKGTDGGETDNVFLAQGRPLELQDPPFKLPI